MIIGGYNKADQNWKSAQQLVRNLIDCSSKGGNYLLNVGPTAEGEIPQPSIERMEVMDGGGTYNHAWSGGPLTMMSQYVLGVAPESVAYGRYLCRRWVLSNPLKR